MAKIQVAPLIAMLEFQFQTFKNLTLKMKIA
jgi:hypothetical protein